MDRGYRDDHAEHHRDGDTAEQRGYERKTPFAHEQTSGQARTRHERGLREAHHPTDAGEDRERNENDGQRETANSDPQPEVVGEHVDVEQ